VKDARFSGWALVVSVVGHAALLSAAALLIADEAGAEPAWASAPLIDPEPGGGGDTFEVDTVIDEGGESVGDAEGTEDQADETDDPAGEEELAPAPDPDPEPQAAPVPDPTPAPAPAPEAAPDPDPDPDPDPASAPDSDPAPEPDSTPSPTSSATPAPSPAKTGTPQASASGKGEGRGKTYGAAGLPRGVRHLAPAFVRAIPPAVSGDGAWARLDLGPVGEVTLTVVVDDEGRVARIDARHEGDEPRNVMQRLVKRTTALLKAGRYALTARPGAAGRETFRVEVTLTQRDPIDQDGANPDDALQLGNEPPTLEAPGKAYFTLASGRHFEAVVTIVASEASASADAPSDEEAASTPDEER
jgi:hypothetical protein